MCRAAWEAESMARLFGDKRGEADRRQLADVRAIERRQQWRRAADREAIEHAAAARTAAEVTAWQARFSAAGGELRP